MTFDQWIDAVNVQVHVHLGDSVRTEELSWDSAMWASPQSTVVATNGEVTLRRRRSHVVRLCRSVGVT